jgi:hypothetical protein
MRRVALKLWHLGRVFWDLGHAARTDTFTYWVRTTSDPCSAWRTRSERLTTRAGWNDTVEVSAAMQSEPGVTANDAGPETNVGFNTSAAGLARCQLPAEVSCAWLTQPLI